MSVIIKKLMIMSLIIILIVMILIITKKDSILYKPYKINENDTLLISEKQEKVFLPYSLQDLVQFTKDSDKKC